MKNRAKVVLLVLSVFLFARISAQEFYNSPKPLTTESNTLNYKLTGNQYYFQSTLLGTVYLNEKWSTGSLKLENGDFYEKVPLKLNTFLEELVVYNQRTGAIFYLDKSIIDEFDMGLEHNSYNLFKKVHLDKLSKGDHYFNVLYDGKVKLYLWHRTVDSQTSPYKDSYGFMRASRYEESNVYFIAFPDNSISRILPQRRSFLKLFPEKKSTLRKAFRKNKVNFHPKMEGSIRAAQLVEKEFF